MAKFVKRLWKDNIVALLSDGMCLFRYLVVTGRYNPLAACCRRIASTPKPVYVSPSIKKDIIIRDAMNVRVLGFVLSIM
jgi:hypothetical protein